MLAGRSLNGISVRSWVSSIGIRVCKISLFMLIICHSHHRFSVRRWIMIWMELWSWHAFSLRFYVVLVWVHCIGYWIDSLAWSCSIDTRSVIWHILLVALRWIWILVLVLVKISDRNLSILSHYLLLLLLGCHCSEGSTILLSCRWIRCARNIFQMIRFLRILLLRERLDGSSLTWQSLRCYILAVLMS